MRIEDCMQHLEHTPKAQGRSMVYNRGRRAEQVAQAVAVAVAVAAVGYLILEIVQNIWNLKQHLARLGWQSMEGRLLVLGSA